MKYILRRASTANTTIEAGELQDLHDLIALLQRPEYLWERRVLLGYATADDGQQDRETIIISIY